MVRVASVVAELQCHLRCWDKIHVRTRKKVNDAVQIIIRAHMTTPPGVFFLTPDRARKILFLLDGARFFTSGILSELDALRKASCSHSIVGRTAWMARDYQIQSLFFRFQILFHHFTHNLMLESELCESFLLLTVCNPHIINRLQHQVTPIITEHLVTHGTDYSDVIFDADNWKRIIFFQIVHMMDAQPFPVSELKKPDVGI